MCSGGADSVALVTLLAQLPTGAAPAVIEVLWVDHGVREDTSEELDAAQAAATAIGATFHTRIAAEHHPGTPHEAATYHNAEARWRDLRYELASDVARERHLDVICTGHSASDQVEQALLSLIGVTGRGGSVDAMPVAREHSPGLQLVRPLLGCTREQLEQACLDAGLAWGVDPTNADPDHAARNAIRHLVVPQLLDVRADAGVAIARAGRHHRDLADTTRALATHLLDAWTADAPDRIDVRRLAQLDPAPRRELVATWLRRAGLGRGLTERAVLAVDRLALLPGRAACSAVDLGRGTCVRRDGYDLAVTTRPDTEGPTP
jgi:tRNA(Ile)-lysidine synthase